jgi:cbb3-type cytochrome oxidase subunit 3
MLFLELLVVAYLVVAILAGFMVFSAIDNKSFRAIFIFLGLVMPIIFLYAAVASLFSRKSMPRFNEEMAKVEDDIETERLRIFGGERTCPSFGDHWERMYQVYLEKLVENAARTSERLVSISTGIHLGRAA